MVLDMYQLLPEDYDKYIRGANCEIAQRALDYEEGTPKCFQFRNKKTPQILVNTGPAEQ